MKQSFQTMYKSQIKFCQDLKKKVLHTNAGLSKNFLTLIEFLNVKFVSVLSVIYFMRKIIIYIKKIVFIFV